LINDKMPACDRWTDGRMDAHDHSVYRSSIASISNNVCILRWKFHKTNWRPSTSYDHVVTKVKKYRLNSHIASASAVSYDYHAERRKLRPTQHGQFNINMAL